MSNKLKGAEIFATGTHNGLEFTDNDLDAIVAAFNALNSAAQVPLKFGHNAEQAISDGQPALGWVQKVWKEGGKLLADFTDVPTVVFDAIKKGLYKKVSVELLKNFNRDGTSFPWVLEAVALLGADKPAVRGLKDLQALAMTSKITGVTFGATVTFTQDNHLGDSNSMTEAEMQAKIDEANKKAQAAVDALDVATKAQFKEKVDAHRVGVKTMLETAITEGRIFPRTRDRILNSVKFKDDAEVLTAYSVESVKAEIEENKRHDFTEKKTVTSRTEKETTEVDLTGKTNAEVVTFRAQAEAVRLGQNPLNADHLSAATKRLFTQDPKLGRAYFDKPHDAYTSDAAA